MDMTNVEKMVTELTTAERLLYSTLKMTSWKDGAAYKNGTGFIMKFAKRDDTYYAAIVTNKHVVEDADYIRVNFHIGNDLGLSGQLLSRDLELTSESLIYHPDDDVDLCAILIGNTFNEAQAAGTPVFHTILEQDLIPADDDWQYFDAIETVTMIGCPNGLSDEVNNLPMSRRGITASSLSKDYNGKSEFMVDMACFPGSSGSPFLSMIETDT